MITILLIVIVVLAICGAFNPTPDKKNKQKDREEIEKLPRIFLKGKKMGGLEKLANLAYDDNKILKSFLYDNGIVTLTMQSGKVLTASLTSMEVHFVKLRSAPIDVTVIDRNYKINFYEMAGLYSSQEWEVIYKVLSLANTTYGTDIFSSWNKNMSKVNSILKILKFLS